MLFFGVCPPEGRVSLSPFEVYRKDLTIMGIFALCYTFLPAMNLLRGGMVDVSPLRTHRFSLSEFPQALQTAIDGTHSLKVQA